MSDQSCPRHEWRVLSQQFGHLFPLPEAPCLHCGMLFRDWDGVPQSRRLSSETTT